MNSPVEWLLLDVGGVLEIVDDEGWPGRFRARWASRLGLSEEEYRDRLDAADLPDIRTRTGHADRYWQEYAAALGATHLVADIRADFWDEYCGTANERLLAALRSLHGSIGLAILSNSGDGAREEEEQRYRFASLFDPICYSHELGVSKPDPRAFELTLARMRAEPSEVLFIDDSVSNVETARRLGLHAHLHTSTGGTLDRISAATRLLGTTGRGSQRPEKWRSQAAGEDSDSAAAR